MKKICILYTALALLSVTSLKAQFGGLINKAKNELKKEDKKEEKKIEEKKEEQKTEVKQNQTPSNSNSTSITTTEKKNDTPTKKLSESEQLYEEFKKGNVVDNGLTSEIHKTYVGKIAFSKAPILEKKEDPTQLLTSFGGSDIIYGRFYLPRSLYNTPIYKIDSLNSYPDRNIYSEFAIEFVIDGVRIEDNKDMAAKRIWEFFINTKMQDYKETKSLNAEDRAKVTSVGFAINLPRADINALEDTKEGYDAPNSFDGVNWPLIANTLSPGDHTIKVLVWSIRDAGKRKNHKPICTSEFKYIKKADDHIKVGPDLNKFTGKAVTKNPALEASMLKVDYATDYEKYKNPIKVILLDKEWAVNTYPETGKPANRYQRVSVIFKDKDGSCYIQTRVWIQQDYASGSYGKMYVRTSDGRDFQVECN